MRWVSKQGDDAYGDVQEKDPAPGVIVGDPAADGGANGGGDDDGHSIERECHAALFRREGVGKDGAAHWVGGLRPRHPE